MTRLAIAEAWADSYHPPSERAIEMGRLYVEEGLTMQEIGDRYGVSRQRVDQIIKPFGFEGHYGRRRKADRMHALNEAYARIVSGSSTTVQEAEQLGYASQDSLRGAFHELGLLLTAGRPAAEHGTVRKYRQGCSCDECRRANREAQYAYRHNRGEPPSHGTASGYVNYACRCPECKGAMRVYRRELKARQRQQQQPTDA